MDALESATRSAREAAGITLIGEKAAIPCPWSGGNGATERSRVGGSIVTLKNDEGVATGVAAYIPVRDVIGESVSSGQIKLSLDGTESGSFVSVDGMKAKIDKVWRAVCSVDSQDGSEAKHLRVGGVPCSIKPVAAAGGGLELILSISSVRTWEEKLNLKPSIRLQQHVGFPWPIGRTGRVWPVRRASSRLKSS